MRKQIPDAAHIIAMTRQGATQKQIADATGISVNGIRRRQRKLGVRAASDRPRPRSSIVTWTPEVQALWEGDLSQKQVAERLGIGTPTLQAAARRAGQYPRPNREPRVDPLAGLTPDQRADVKALQKARYSQKEAIAKVTAPKVKMRAMPVNTQQQGASA